jgi:NAD(P)-dependent dehydrogenase (short-subunit alcohol dehydrogenase family)
VNPVPTTARLLDGRTALVTGASSGLGRHFMGVLAAHGARVVGAARRADALDAAVDALRAHGGDATAVQLDVRDAASVEAALRACGPVDIVVNNAGIAQTRRATEVAEDDWQSVIDTNLSGAFRVAAAAARSMVAAARPGVIVNIASVLGFRVAKQLPAYVAAKAGLVRLTEALALEWAAHRIRVNALAPGYIETEINRDFLHSEAGAAIARRIPQRRFGQPSDLDGALLLLAGPAGEYITGTTLTVDGGHTLAWL